MERIRNESIGDSTCWMVQAKPLIVLEDNIFFPRSFWCRCINVFILSVIAIKLVHKT